MLKEDSELKLAEAMEKLAEAILNFQDPVRWQKIISDALRVGAFARPIELPHAIAPPVLPQELNVGHISIDRIEAVTISLSDEERKKVVEEIHALLKPQLTEFNAFVKVSLEKMPGGRLKALGDKVRAGVGLKLSQRAGCIFIEAGDEDFYLGL